MLQVARGLPILPAVPLSRRERRHRSNVALLPLGMAVLAAQSFVEQRLYSADICRNLIEGEGLVVWCGCSVSELCGIPEKDYDLAFCESLAGVSCAVAVARLKRSLCLDMSLWYFNFMWCDA